MKLKTLVNRLQRKHIMNIIQCLSTIVLTGSLVLVSHFVRPSINNTTKGAIHTKQVQQSRSTSSLSMNYLLTQNDDLNLDHSEPFDFKSSLSDNVLCLNNRDFDADLIFVKSQPYLNNLLQVEEESTSKIANKNTNKSNDKSTKATSIDSTSDNNADYSGKYNPVMYVNTTYANLNVHTNPNTSSEIIAKLPRGSSVLLIDSLSSTTNSFVKILSGGQSGYIYASYLSEEEPKQLIQPATTSTKKSKGSKSKKSSKKTKSSSTTYTAPTDSNYSGQVLNSKNGIVAGPSGKETYYNLNMSKVVSNMHDKGYTGEYWVRDDGAKMMGEFVIVAADLDVHPRGSLVETSLGTGIVADTGSFAQSNSNQIDIATTW